MLPYNRSSQVRQVRHVYELWKECVRLDKGGRKSRTALRVRRRLLYRCRSTCIMPAAILKALEVAASLFVPRTSHIEFIAGAL